MRSTTGVYLTHKAIFSLFGKLDHFRILILIKQSSLKHHLMRSATRICTAIKLCFCTFLGSFLNQTFILSYNCFMQLFLRLLYTTVLYNCFTQLFYTTAFTTVLYNCFIQLFYTTVYTTVLVCIRKQQC